MVSESNLVPAPQIEDQQQNEGSLETTSEEHPSAGHTNEEETFEEVSKYVNILKDVPISCVLSKEIIEILSSVF